MVYQDPRYRDPEYGTKWRAANPEKAREYSRRHLSDPVNREANRKRASAHYYANRAQRLDHQRAYNEANRETIADKNLIRKYGLSVVEREALLLSQGGRCAICGVDGRLSIDHDHASGIVRGLLCANCNFLIGHGKDSPALLRSAADYLEGTSDAD